MEGRGVACLVGKRELREEGFPRNEFYVNERKKKAGGGGAERILGEELSEDYLPYTLRAKGGEM